MDEQSLVRLYMDLTGASESCARGVLMYVVPPTQQAIESSNGTSLNVTKEFEPTRSASARKREYGLRPDSRSRILPALPQPLASLMKNNFSPVFRKRCGESI
jgi:hypothetical protein